ncbi:ATP-dependent DNA helicase 2 subunit [Nymphaea thermarum]|nr:ATP-dependent DNA helicase 2 subunit [Nymphaea thermarum]
MDIDAENLFRDDDEDPESEFYEVVPALCSVELREKEATKEFVVYLVDAAPSMFVPFRDENGANITHFQVAMNCISMSLKTLIVNRDYDEVAVCFFNTREKMNLQDLGGVFVFNVLERDDLDRPTARLIKELSHINESFIKSIGSRSGIVSGARDNPLYNAIWVAQALLRKGSVKNVDKRILLFTNEDDPFGCLQGAIKSDMKRTTLQRAKDAQDLGISIELLPMNRPGEEFNELLGLEDDQIAEFMPSAVEKAAVCDLLVFFVVISPFVFSTLPPRDPCRHRLGIHAAATPGSMPSLPRDPCRCCLGISATAALGSVPPLHRDPCTLLPRDPRRRLGFRTIASGSVPPSPREPCNHRLGNRATIALGSVPLPRDPCRCLGVRAVA